MDTEIKELSVKDTMSDTNDAIDLLSIAKTLWRSRHLYLITCSLAIVVGIIVAFSVPKTWKSTVVLAPELAGGSSLSGGISDIASMVGLNIGTNGSSIDAIYPELYPQIVQSVPFVTGLFNVQVQPADSNTAISFYDYLKKGTKYPWWTRCVAAIKKIFKSKGKKGVVCNKVDNFRLTEEQYGLVQQIKGCVNCNVDKKTSIITVSVTLQDPIIAANIADTVRSRIQQYIINYRTQKARNDMNYYQRLCSEAKASYVKAQGLYSSYSDSNEGVILESYKSKQEELENDMQLRYNIYTQCAQQLQAAKAKVQERTPAFTILEPATVPIKKEGPKRMTIVIVFVFLAIVVTSVYILYKDASKQRI